MYLLDSRAKRFIFKQRRVSVFNSTLEGLFEGYLGWLESHRYRPEHIIYARVFDADTFKHLGNLNFEGNDKIIYEPTPNSELEFDI